MKTTVPQQQGSHAAVVTHTHTHTDGRTELLGTISPALPTGGRG